MRYLKHALIFFAVVDVLIFVVSQANPELLVRLQPQFDLESVDNTYPRLVGILFLMLGLARFYGAMYIDQQGALIVSMWSWVVELIYTITEILHGQFVTAENLMALFFAPLMLGWSLAYFRKALRSSGQ